MNACFFACGMIELMHLHIEIEARMSFSGVVLLTCQMIALQVYSVLGTCSKNSPVMDTQRKLFFNVASNIKKILKYEYIKYFKNSRN